MPKSDGVNRSGLDESDDRDAVGGLIRRALTNQSVAKPANPRSIEYVMSTISKMPDSAPLTIFESGSPWQTEHAHAVAAVFQDATATNAAIANRIGTNRFKCNSRRSSFG